MLFAVQVFHSYGDKNNEVLLQYYGFVEDVNVNDYYTADLLQFVKAHGNVTTERLEEWESSPYLLTLQQVAFHFAVMYPTCVVTAFDRTAFDQPLILSDNFRQTQAHAEVRCMLTAIVHQFYCSGKPCTFYTSTAASVGGRKQLFEPALQMPRCTMGIC